MSLCLLVSRGAIAQDADVVDVNVSGTDFEFLDRYEFQHDANTLKGVLKLGGFLTTATVTEYVQETKTKTETYTVVVFKKGKRVLETRTRQVPYTVVVPVTVQVPVTLPEIKGYWYALGDKSQSVWVVRSVQSSGVVIGIGFRYGQTVHGIITYLFSSNLSGRYDVSTNRGNPQ